MTTSRLLIHPLDYAIARCRWADVSAGFVPTTPELAEMWLDSMAPNRNLRTQRIPVLAADMEADRWPFEGSPIRFDHDNALVDGQHRLHALIRARATLTFLVVCGLSPEAMDVIDTGGKRTGSDMFGIHGREHRVQLAALVNVVSQWKQGRIQTTASRLSGAASSNALLFEVEQADSRIAEAVSTAMQYKNRISATATATGFFLWLIPEHESSRAREFLDAVAEHRSTGSGDPVLAVIRRLDNRFGEGDRRLGPVEGAYILLRGWQAYRAGEQLERIPLAQHNKPMDFPIVPAP